MFCEKCGNEISNNALFCPNCGGAVGGGDLQSALQQDNRQDEVFYRPNMDPQMVAAVNEAHAPKGHSGLSIAALICTILIWTSPIGFVLAIVDAIKNKDDGRKHILSYVSIGICAFFILIIIVVGIRSGSSEKKNAHSVENTYDSGAQGYSDSYSDMEENTSDAGRDDNEISPEFKREVDAIEEFYNDYCDFMERYAAAASTGDVMSLMNDYTRFMSDYTTYATELEKFNSNQDSMTQAELNYFLDAYNRIMKRMANVAYSAN